MKKKKWIIGIIVVVVMLMIIVNLKSGNSNVSSVTVEKASKRSLVEKVSATGEIKPKKNINISTYVAGKIQRIMVKEGDVVIKGQLLMKIDSAMYEANADRDRGIIASSKADLISQEASLKKARQFFERRKQLFAEGLIPKEQFEDAETQLDMADANRNATKFRIDQAMASLKSTDDSIQKTYINSPIDGIVTSLKVEEGEVAIIGTMNNPGTVLMTIADLSVMEAEVRVDETDVVNVRLGKSAEVRVDALPGQILHGEVTEVGNSALTGSNQTAFGTTTEAKDFKTVITLTQPPTSLKPGFSATADIIIDSRENALSIPIAAIVLQEGKDAGKKGKDKEREGVFLMRDGKAYFAEIQKGISGDMYVEVLSGLKENDQIISGPFAVLKKLKDGDPVKVQKNK